MLRFTSIFFALSLCLAQQAQAQSEQEPAQAPESASAAKAVEQPAAAAPVYTPLSQRIWKGMAVSLPLHIGGVAENSSGFALDRFGTQSTAEASFQPLIRLGAKFSSLRRFERFTLMGEYQHDLLAGPAGQGLQMDEEGQLEDRSLSTQLRKAYAVASFENRLWVGGGAMTSHWGLGMLSNNGEQYWQPGSARFASPRGADRVLRGFAVIGINRKLGLALTLGADKVLGDDALLTEADRLRADQDDIVEDDSAHQFLGALRVGEGKKSSGGIYLAYRDQSSVDGSSTQVLAVDLTGKTELGLERGTLHLEAEAAVITGETTWAPTMDYGAHQVRQIGLAARASYHDRSELGGVMDLLYASGDQNFDDEAQTGFKTDRNYEMGLLLFRQVLASQTARAVGSASDPELVGEPADDIERFATRGGATNTVAFFPRGYYRPIDGLEVYGGPLVAFTPVKYADPLNSRLAGGTPRNALDGEPGNYLGTELDLGLRYRTLFGGTELTLGLEGGVLVPGTVFKDIEGRGLGNIYGARAMLDYHL